MKKKKNTNQTLQLSPENYIRLKSKNLPIYKCFINDSWEEDKLCYIFITRKHSTGHITSCMYLVDLKCLGVKDTQFQFNLSYSEFERILKRAESFTTFSEVSYELVHNIIFAGIEYAEQYGFYPHKDFSSTTIHFLEEDNNTVDLMEIECGGENGKPLYFYAGSETPIQVKQILAKLEKTAGTGNYDYIVEAHDDLLNDNDLCDDEEEDEDFDLDMALIHEKIEHEFGNLDMEGKKKMFLELHHKEMNDEDLSNDEKVRLLILTNLLIYSFADQKEVSNHLGKWEEKFNVGFVDIDVLPNSLFKDVRCEDGEKIADLFEEAYYNISNGRKYKQALTNLIEEVGEAPVIAFLELYLLSKKQNPKYVEKVEQMYRKYPDYFLIQQYYFIEKGKLLDISFFEKILTKQKLPVTFFEADFFFNIFLFRFMRECKAPVEKVLALELFYSTLDFLSDETHEKILDAFITYKYDEIIKHYSFYYK
jgi:hypothetical protein